MNNIILTKGKDFPELELYKGNKEVHLLRYYEPEPGLFIAETHNVIEIALRCGYEPVSAIIQNRMLDNPLINKLGNIPVYLLDEEDTRARLGYILTDGISCLMRRRPNPDYREILENAGRIIVLEDVENPTNVGAIIRSAAALGVDAIILSPACVDPLYRRAVRVSVGNVFLIPWAYMCRSEQEWQQNGIRMLKELGFATAAMALRRDNVNIDDPILKKEHKLALIMGNEGNGLCDETINNSDYVVKIPMMNGVDSLNVAVAAALGMWELMKPCPEP